MKSENIHNKREIEQSEARDKLAKVLSGMIPLGSSVWRAVKSLALFRSRMPAVLQPRPVISTERTE